MLGRGLPVAIATVHRALELGITFLDTADVYGFGANEELVGRASSRRRVQLRAAFACESIRVASLEG